MIGISNKLSGGAPNAGPWTTASIARCQGMAFAHFFFFFFLPEIKTEFPGQAGSCLVQLVTTIIPRYLSPTKLQ